MKKFLSALFTIFVLDCATPRFTNSYPGPMNNIISCFETARNIEYVSDMPGVDYWQTPRETLERGAGDCDDQALLLEFELSNMGIPSRVVYGRSRPNMDYAHMWVEVNHNGNVLVLDPTIAEGHAGIFERRLLPENRYIETIRLPLSINQRWNNYLERATAERAHVEN